LMNTLYFAYGSNMDANQMNRRCPGAECAGTATLEGYRFIINKRGYATLSAETCSQVYGVIWLLSNEHEKALDRYEGYKQGLYDKCFRIACRRNEDHVPCLVYIDHRNQSAGHPRAGYMERIIDAAVAHEFPDTYVGMLESWRMPNPSRHDLT